MGLAAYQQDTTSLINDYGNLFLPLAQMTRWINEARRQVAYRTGCIRVLVSGQSPWGSQAQAGSMIPGGAMPGVLVDAGPSALATLPVTAVTNSFYAIQGVERYPYDFANPYIKSGNQGVGNMFDVVDVAVSWGGVRPTMAWKPWDELQAYARSYNVGVFSYPFLWSTFNDSEFGQVWLFPCPTQTTQGITGIGEMEWDVLCAPLDLNTDSDFDAIPPGFQNAVKFGAASLCFLSQQKFTQAAALGTLFLDRLGVSRSASEGGRVSDYYYGSLG